MGNGRVERIVLGAISRHDATSSRRGRAHRRGCGRVLRDARREHRARPVGRFACNTVQHQFREYHFCGSTLDVARARAARRRRLLRRRCGCCCGRAHPRVGLVGATARRACCSCRPVHRRADAARAAARRRQFASLGLIGPSAAAGLRAGRARTGPPHADGLSSTSGVDGAALAVSVDALRVLAFSARGLASASSLAKNVRVTSVQRRAAASAMDKSTDRPRRPHDSPEPRAMCVDVRA